MDEIETKIDVPREPTPDEQEKIDQLLATELERRVKERFANQGFWSWQERAVPNIFGIIKDLNVGSDIDAKKRRWTSKGTGVDTGALKNSISITAKGNGEFVFSCLDYGRKFHEGGSGRVPFGSAFRKNLYKWYKKKKNKEKRSLLAWLFGYSKKHSIYEIETPARSLVEEEDVIEVANAAYKEILQ